MCFSSVSVLWVKHLPLYRIPLDLVLHGGFSHTWALPLPRLHPALMLWHRFLSRNSRVMFILLAQNLAAPTSPSSPLLPSARGARAGSARGSELTACPARGELRTGAAEVERAGDGVGTFSDPARSTHRVMGPALSPLWGSAWWGRTLFSQNSHWNVAGFLSLSLLQQTWCCTRLWSASTWARSMGTSLGASSL